MPLDATRQAEIESLLRRERPDLVLQCASLTNPWTILAGEAPGIARLRAAGVALQLPSMLPVALTAARAAREVGRGVFVNLSWPDAVNVILGRLGLAPEVGLGNATMMASRVRAALRRHALEGADRGAAPPLVRVIGGANALWNVLTAKPPEDPAKGCRVYLGDDGRRRDEWAYKGPPLASGSEINELTCASSVAILPALLPGGPAIRASCPGVRGLYGGYPVRVAGGAVSFDLPPGVTMDEAVGFNESCAERDGIERIERDGTVVYTEAARAMVRDIDPVLAEPLAPNRAAERFPRLMAAIERCRAG